MRHITLNLTLVIFLSSNAFFKSFSQPVQQSTTTLQPQTFPYRGWRIAVDAEQLDVEELYFNVAVTKAKEYNINTLELHDFE